MTHNVEPRPDAPFVASSRAGLYLRPGMVRLLSSIIVALALFLSPLAMASGSGMAMSHPAAASTSEAAGHCGGSETPADDGKGPVKLSCASACAAFLPAGPAASDEAPADPAVLTHAGPQLLVGVHPEGETPPPRMTPEI